MGTTPPVVRLPFVGAVFYTKTPRVLDICDEHREADITVQSTRLYLIT